EAVAILVADGHTALTRSGGVGSGAVNVLLRWEPAGWFLRGKPLMSLRHCFSVLTMWLAAGGHVPAAWHLADGTQGGQIEHRLKELNDRLAKLRTKTPSAKSDYLADAEIYAKGMTWALRYDEKLTAADEALLQKAIERGNERAAALEAGKQPWTSKKGKVIRAFVSAVDGSVQPYGVIVPANYDQSKPIRLDVVLHGSPRPVGMSELNFLSRFDEGDVGTDGPVEHDYIELHPLGRVENCYRWAGETDVFEAIEAVCRNYNIDRDRVVLRGMSMG